jgi:transcription antitermination factor NusG
MNELELRERNWHALYVRSRSEKKVLSQLQEMGFEAYLPLVTKIKQWSDRRKKIEEPLFKSYVFVYSNAMEYLSILNVYGVMRFVSFERKPVDVPDNQILAIKRFVEDYEHGEEFKMQNDEVLKVGQMVRIINGPMKNLKGSLHTICNKRLLVVYIEAVGQYLPITISRARVEPIIES